MLKSRCNIRLDTKLGVDVVATVGYPFLTLAILIGLLCIVLAIWILMNYLAASYEVSKR
jgi:hypothetical protein